MNHDGAFTICENETKSFIKIVQLKNAKKLKVPENFLHFSFIIMEHCTSDGGKFQ